MNKKPEKILKEVTLELVEYGVPSKPCDSCIFEVDSCPAGYLTGCKGGYWRVKKSWVQATEDNVKVGDIVRLQDNKGGRKVHLLQEDEAVVDRMDAECSVIGLTVHELKYLEVLK